jgi:hypothetical protein
VMVCRVVESSGSRRGSLEVAAAPLPRNDDGPDFWAKAADPRGAGEDCAAAEGWEAAWGLAS